MPQMSPMNWMIISVMVIATMNVLTTEPKILQPSLKIYNNKTMTNVIWLW